MRVIKYLYILPDFIDNCFFHLFCMGTWETYRRSLKNARRQGNHFCSPINQHLSPGNSSFTGHPPQEIIPTISDGPTFSKANLPLDAHLIQVVPGQRSSVC